MRRFNRGGGPQTLFDLRPGMDIAEMGGAFSGETGASYRDRDGVMQFTAVADELRDAHFINGVRYILVEGIARENRALHSQDFSNGVYTVSGTPTVITGVATAPDGTLTANSIQDNDTGAVEVVRQSFVVANDGAAYVSSIFVQKITTTPTFYPALNTRLLNGTPVDQYVIVNPQAGTVVSTAATGRYGIEDWNDEWWRVWVSATNNTSGNTNLLISIYAAFNADFTTSSSATAVGTTVFWGLHVQPGIVPTSYIPTTTAIVSHDADILDFDYDEVPQEQTIFVRGVDLGIAAESQGLWLIGSGSVSANTSLLMFGNSGEYRGIHRQAVDRTALVTGMPTFGASVEYRMLAAANGSVTLAQSINGAAEVVGSASAALTFSAGYDAQKIYLGRQAPSSLGGCFAFAAFRIAAGTQSMATMRYGFADAITLSSAEMVHLLQLEFESGTVRLSTGAQDLLWDGETWEAVGGALAVGGVEETADARGQGVDVDISGVDQTVLAALLNSQYRGRDARVYRAYLNPETGLLADDPFLLFKGLQLHPYTVEEETGRGGGTVRIRTRFAGYLSVDRVRGIQTNTSSHQHHFPGDVFFQHTSSLTNHTLAWGTASPVRVNRGSGVPPGPVRDSEPIR